MNSRDRDACTLPADPTETPGTEATHNGKVSRETIAPQKLITVTIVLLSLALVYILFVPPVLGLADQGDFNRVLLVWGIQHKSPVDLRFFGWLDRDYETGFKRELASVSTEHIFVATALALHSSFSKSPDFNLGWLAAVHAAAYIVVIWLLLRSVVPLGNAAVWTSCVLALLIGSDLGYTAYLNSWYTEVAALIFGLLLLSVVFRVAAAARHTPKDAAALIISSALFVGSKAQNAPLVFLIAPACGWWLIRRRSALRWKIGCCAGCVALTGFAVWGMTMTPGGNVNLYNSIFMNVLPGSADPGADLTELGLDRSLARFSGQHAYLPGVPISDPRLFPVGASRSKLAVFYLTHPFRTVAVLWRWNKADSALRNHLCCVGNFERSAGLRPQTLAHSFSIWDGIRGHIGLSGAAILLLLNLIASYMRQQRLVILLVVMIVTSFSISVLGEGMIEGETQKHLLTTNLMLDLLLAIDIVSIVVWLARRREHAPEKASVIATIEKACSTHA